MLLAIEGSEVVVGVVRLFARIFPFFYHGFLRVFVGSWEYYLECRGTY